MKFRHIAPDPQRSSYKTIQSVTTR